MVCLGLRSTHLKVCRPLYKLCSILKDVGAADVNPDAKPYRMTSRYLLLRPRRWESIALSIEDLFHVTPEDDTLIEHFLLFNYLNAFLDSLHLTFNIPVNTPPTIHLPCLLFLLDHRQSLLPPLQHPSHILGAENTIG